MRRILAFAATLALTMIVATPSATAAASRTATSYVSVGCWVGWENPYWRPTGLDGQVEHDGAVITYDLWVHDASGWRSVGTEVDTVMDESNARTGVELFRGSFIVTSSLGNFAGTFVWQENKWSAWGHGQGIATDGSGLLWKATPGVIDPETTGVPDCALDRAVYNLTLLELIKP